MKIAQILILDATRRTPWLTTAQSRYLAPHIQTMLAGELSPYIPPSQDPLLYPPDLVLKSVVRQGTDTMRTPEHGIVGVLRQLLVSGKDYVAEVPVSAIRAVSATRAKNHRNLDVMPEAHLYLRSGENYGPLSDDEMEGLKKAAFNDLGWADGVVELDELKWTGTYVLANQGSPERFALWRRLLRGHLGKTTVQARVKPHDINLEALHALRSRWRLIHAKWKVLGAILDAEEILPDSFYSFGHGSSLHSTQFWAVPYPHHMPRQLSGIMDALHRKIDEAGVLDLGRYLSEEIAAAKRVAARPAHER